MRIMLYRTLDNMIEGVVITFMDVTVSKTLEAKLRETQAGLHKQIIEQRNYIHAHSPTGKRFATPPTKGRVAFQWDLDAPLNLGGRTFASSAKELIVFDLQLADVAFKLAEFFVDGGHAGSFAFQW